MGGSGASPGFSIGGGAGSGTGGKSPGGTPGLGAGGLGTCCAWSASNFSKTKVLSLRAAHGAVVAFAGDAPANAFSPWGFITRLRASCTPVCRRGGSGPNRLACIVSSPFWSSSQSKKQTSRWTTAEEENQQAAISQALSLDRKDEPKKSNSLV
jgi:hypothetical protein